MTEEQQIRQLAEDLAKVSMVSVDVATDALNHALAGVQPRALKETFASFGVMAHRRWYERPAWLWRKRWQRRVYKAVTK